MNLNHPNTNHTIATPEITKQILKKYDLSLKKSLGQNFMTDENVLKKMLDVVKLDTTKGIIEIGPGIGALTQKLAQVAGKVLVIEIDQRLIPVLQEIFHQDSHVKVVHGDILKIDLSAWMASEFTHFPSVHVIANLPYYITTPILFKLLESKLPIESIVVMIQKEVAERITAPPGTKDYNSLSIAIQYYCQSDIVSIVPRTVFVPQPNVDSAIVHLQMRQAPPVEVSNEDFFFQLVRDCFAQRRKTLLNNLNAKYIHVGNKTNLQSMLLDLGIDPMRRAETLTISEFALLANTLGELHFDHK
jgi:16S rRNA (adenine1518-N6/adenine1519-N6)-dimethyltransferase